MKTENKGREIFFGVVALATLIVAIIGATLAYFSITASSNEGAVNAQSAIVSIEYNDGQQVTAQADQLIPATLDIVQRVYEARFKDATNITNPDDASNICIDSHGLQVCSAYRFTVKSDIERTITAELRNEENQFTYLSYAVYNVTQKKWMTLNDDDDLFIDLTTCTSTAGEEEGETEACFTETGQQKKYSNKAINSIFGKTVEPGSNDVIYKGETISGTTQAYDLVLFIRETNKNQNVDQGKQYRGTIAIEVVEGAAGGSVSGYIDPTDENFQ